MLYHGVGPGNLKPGGSVGQVQELSMGLATKQSVLLHMRYYPKYTHTQPPHTPSPQTTAAMLHI
jgi:hypothetical protein